MSGYLIDSSVFIARERNRSVGEAPPGQARISVATLTELVMGVERAAGPRRRPREHTLAQARKFIPLAYDDFVAERLGRLMAAAREPGRRPDLMDAIIAATALVHDLTVWTQDADFEALAELEPKLRVARA
jgi:predicted nucleic acid-binding protein